MSRPAMPRVTAAHERKIRERILVAAARAFAEKGYHRATVQDIVRESGLSIGAIYTYFASKEEVYLAMCDLASGRALGELAVRLTAGASAAEKLAIAVGFYIDTIDPHAETPGLAALAPAWAEADEPAVREMLRRRRDQLVTAGRMLLEEAIARGDLPAWADADALAWAFTALLDGIFLQRIEAGAAWRREDAERRARVMLEIVLAATTGERRPVPEIAAHPWSLTG